MAKIFEMPPHLADLIAAGEVVERPGSVVKELVENSIDAGASAVTVEIKNGGMGEIRVTDNGSGIAREDVKTAFLRHATSKLRDERGLEAIGTLGFRGEALAAIAAVSRIELITRERGSAEGTRLTLEGGVPGAEEPLGCPDGTTIYVRDLFFNTPARLKFMKNDRAEGANVTTVVTRLALSHPEVSIRYLREGREEFQTPGDGSLRSAVYSTLGRDAARDLLPVESETDGGRVTGFVSTPAGCRGNRSWQFFFINGRFIKSKLLQAAVEQAYRNSLFTGRFPVCLIDIKTGLSAVDVNVHPTKMEVRFADERRIFDAVYWAVRGALEREPAPGEAMPVSEGTLRAVREPSAPARNAAPSGNGGAAHGHAAPRENFYRTMPAEKFRESFAGGFKTSVPAVSERRRNTAEFHDSAAPFQTAIPLPRERADAWQPAKTRETAPARDFRYIGEAMNTYLICERGESIFLIDKHAAHERIIFDKLRGEKHDAMSQVLMSPVVCSLGEDAAAVIEENRQLLSQLGFELEDFGGGSVAIRQVPADMDMSDPRGLLEEIAGKFSAGGRREVEDMRDEVLHTVACKAAIKAGRRSEPEEVMDLIGRVLSGEIKYCPHGRPVVMELTRGQLERGFKRA